MSNVIREYVSINGGKKHTTEKIIEITKTITKMNIDEYGIEEFIEYTPVIALFESQEKMDCEDYLYFITVKMENDELVFELNHTENVDEVYILN